ncbi:ferrochelatase [Paraphotobacterium marinum]|uniref:Ferrochelatase n=1 Tax=Paraphotobacterium marinum TaxID=1755811 RepID=A0A220VDV7_9GAMM|nr:ferrochelatase [Paraphotobacterium marinum]ASK78527.1 ferrochelatase [Paraphotobacterium marinum]
MKKKGLLLVNLGSPESYSKKDIRAFLKQFLSDRRVIEKSPLIWKPILYLVILPFRSRKNIEAYKSIWTEKGSPLKLYSRKQKEKIEDEIDFPVEYSMTYGEPSISNALKELIESKNCENIMVLPMFPQFSATTSAAVFDQIGQYFKNKRFIPQIQFINYYFNHPHYIRVLANSITQHRKKHKKSNLIICSYHGIPKDYSDKGDPYYEQCIENTKLLKEELKLSDKDIITTFQSRLGPQEWLKPYTFDTLKALGKQGIQEIDILSPSFSVDCLETLEEIKEEAEEVFISAGGKKLNYIPCLNDENEHIQFLVSFIKENFHSTSN